MRLVHVFWVVALATGLSACKDGLVVPDRFGTIEGQVLDFRTFAPISGALISTSPATSTVRTDENGAFTVSDALIGTYTITARRSGFTANTTSIAVREGQVTRADVLLDLANTDTTVTTTSFGAEVLNFTNEAFGPDSSYVSVEYRALNNGTANIPAYEIYFRIDTNRGSFYREVAGTDLGPGQNDFGSFRKYIIGATATGVVIEGTSTPNARSQGPVAARSSQR